MKKSCTLFLLLFFCFALAHARSDWPQVEKIFGRKGTLLPGGVFKVTFPRSDLHVTLNGIVIEPALALTSWMAFKPMGDKTMIMGDLALLEGEVNPVMSVLSKERIEVTALHNHLLWESPRIMYLHFEGIGSPASLASGMKKALQATGTPLAAGLPHPFYPLPDWSRVEAILGKKGTAKGNLLHYGFPPAEVVTEHGMRLPPAMLSSPVNFQKLSGDKVAATGDFVLLPDQVNPVARTLQQAGVKVTAIHNHMLSESPRIFFLHWWGVGSMEQIAGGIRSALGKAGVKLSHGTSESK